MKKIDNITQNSGQILVVLLLIMIVGLTVGLFLMGRTTSDISLTGELTESSRAFNAAEAGIEEAIRSFTGVVIVSPVPGATPTPVPVASGVSYTIDTENLGTGTGLIYPQSKNAPTALGDAFTVWLVDHDPTTGEIIPTPMINGMNDLVYVCFDNPGAVGVTLYYINSSGQTLSAYTGFDPNAGRRATNGFLNTFGSGCTGYNIRGQLRFRDASGLGVRPDQNTLVALRIRPVYNTSAIAVQLQNSSMILPTQGADISSLGISGDTSRRIDVEAPYKIPAPFMDQAIYSLSDTVGLNK